MRRPTSSHSRLEERAPTEGRPTNQATTESLRYFPKRNESSIIGRSPLTPTSLTVFSSGASEVASIKQRHAAASAVDRRQKDYAAPNLNVAVLGIARDAFEAKFVTVVRSDFDRTFRNLAIFVEALREL